MKSAYQAKFGKAFVVPATWDDYSQVAQFITDQLAPNVYGAAHFRKFGSPGNQFSFLQEFRANGGRFFDDAMKAQLATSAGTTTLNQMIAQNKASLPGNNDLDAVAQWAAWLQGKVAMIFSWPPTGRMSSNYAQRDKAINFIPQSSIADKVGYAPYAGGHGEMASGYVKALAAGSNNEEAAYLFMQWVSAPPLSLVRTMLPYTLRDPYRLSTYKSEQYRALWPAAKDYLINLCECSNNGGRRYDHAGLAGLCAVDRPDVLGRMGRRGSPGRPEEGGGGMGHDDATARRRRSEGGVQGIPASARLLRRSYDRDAREIGACDLTTQP